MPTDTTPMPISTTPQDRALAVSVINQFLSARCEDECPICYEA